MIRWVFFDVGNVIMNDDPALAMLYKLLHERIKEVDKNIELETIFARRETLILKSREGQHYRRIAKEFLGEKNWHSEYKNMLRKLSQNWEFLSPLMPEIVPVIRELYKDYNLGIIANQPIELNPNNVNLSSLCVV